MKKGDFLWSAYRITEKQKAGKARNIKEKQLKNSRSTVSRQLVAHLSSQRDNFSSARDHRCYLYCYLYPGSIICFRDFFCGAPGGARFRKCTFSEGWFAGMQLVGAMYLQRGCIRIGKILLAGMHLLGRNNPCGEKEQAGDENWRKKSSLRRKRAS